MLESGGKKMENYKQTKKLERIVACCVLFGVAVIVLAISSFVSLGKARRKNAEYDNLIASLKNQEMSVESDIANFDIEERARYQYGMIKEGETYYIFEK